jgi:hypothetical protein
VIFVTSGFVLSKITCEPSVTEDTVIPVYPYISSKFILKFIIHSVNGGGIVFVMDRPIHDPKRLSMLLHFIVADIPVRFSLPVNDTVMVSPTFAHPLLAFEEVMWTSVSVGGIPNSVKCSVSNVHTCSIPGRSLPVQ